MDDHSSLEAVITLLNSSDSNQLAEVIARLTPSEINHLVSRLDDGQHARLLKLLPIEASAALVRSLPLALSSDVLSDLAPAEAAAILNQLPSDEQTDVLSSLNEPFARSVLAEMAPAEVEDVHRLSRFAEDTAGGLMATEFLAFPATTTVGQVVTDLRTHATEYSQYLVQYIYALSGDGSLQGVVRVRDLLFHHDDQLLNQLSLHAPVAVKTNASLSELRDLFERYRFFAAPVVDVDNRLLGVVTRADFDEAWANHAAKAFLRFSGIVLGEEFRSMPLLTRTGSRLAWLAITMLLSFLAASVVGIFQDTLGQIITLAVFLPVISGMSGNAGNQAIAVTMRELSLGLVKPHESMWVLAKEANVGLINGFILGLAMTIVAVLWKGNLQLGLVVGAAQMLSVLLAVCLGGTIPLLIKRLGFDPAIASAPLLTTVTDATGFFLTLVLASRWLAT